MKAASHTLADRWTGRQSCPLSGRYRTLLAAAVLITGSTSATAEWLIGPLLLIDAPFRTDSQSDIDPFPYVAWESGPWHIGVDEATYDFGWRSDLQFTAYVEPRFTSDGPARMDGLEPLQRDTTVDVGLSVDVSFFPWTMSAALQTDVTGEHDGSEANLGAGVAFPFADGTLEITHTLRLRDRQLANFLYGVGTEEAYAELPAYTSSARGSYELSVQYQLGLTERSAFVLQLDVEMHPKDLRESPRIDQFVDASGLVAWIWSFR